MGLCGWVAFGFFAGLFARAITPGTQRMGFIATTLLGIAGAFAGGVIVSILQGRSLFVLYPAGFIGAVVGSMVLLVLGRALSKKA
jgi:uncharacterized membrane protein YeaQ/YmgE (transglycosylase-associated protein family)